MQSRPQVLRKRFLWPTGEDMNIKQNLINKQRRESFEKAVLLEMVELLVKEAGRQGKCPPWCTCSMARGCKNDLLKKVRQRATVNVRINNATKTD